MTQEISNFQDSIYVQSAPREKPHRCFIRGALKI